MFFDDRVNIALYEPENLGSCREAVDFLNSNPVSTRDLARRGRDAVLRMNSAVLFRERWSRVLDAAGAAAGRGQRRLVDDAAADLSEATSIRLATTDYRRYSLATSMIIGEKSLSISHPAESWNIPRSFIHKYVKLRSYSEVKWDLVSAAASRGGVVYDIGRDLGFYGYLSIERGAEVKIFNRPSCIVGHIRETILNNCINNICALDTVVDDGNGETWFSPLHRTDRGNNSDERTELVSTISLDEYAALNSDEIVRTIIIDDPSFETRIIEGSIQVLKKHKPEIIINCYRHGSYANGAPISRLIRVLKDLGYITRACSWDGNIDSLRNLSDDSEPDYDVALLHAVHENYIG